MTTRRSAAVHRVAVVSSEARSLPRRHPVDALPRLAPRRARPAHLPVRVPRPRPVPRPPGVVRPVVRLRVRADVTPPHDDALDVDAPDDGGSLAAVLIRGEDVFAYGPSPAVDRDVVRVLRPHLHDVPVRLKVSVALAPVHAVFEDAPVAVHGVPETLRRVSLSVLPALPQPRLPRVVVSHLAPGVPLIPTRGRVPARRGRVHSLARGLGPVPRGPVRNRRVAVAAVGSLVDVIIPRPRERRVDALLHGAIRASRGPLTGAVASGRRHVHVRVEEVDAVLSGVTEVRVPRVPRKRAVTHVQVGRLPVLPRPHAVRGLIDRVRALTGPGVVRRRLPDRGERHDRRFHVSDPSRQRIHLYAKDGAAGDDGDADGAVANLRGAAARVHGDPHRGRVHVALARVRHHDRGDVALPARRAVGIRVGQLRDRGRSRAWRAADGGPVEVEEVVGAAAAAERELVVRGAQTERGVEAVAFEEAVHRVHGRVRRDAAAVHLVRGHSGFGPEPVPLRGGVAGDGEGFVPVPKVRPRRLLADERAKLVVVVRHPDEFLVPGFHAAVHVRAPERRKKRPAILRVPQLWAPHARLPPVYAVGAVRERLRALLIADAR
eukprot:20873-Pelagococcus_subviridis.AAC.6